MSQLIDYHIIRHTFITSQILSFCDNCLFATIVLMNVFNKYFVTCIIVKSIYITIQYFIMSQLIGYHIFCDIFIISQIIMFL